MLLYSYKGQQPSPLPFRVRLDSGETRTSLEYLSVSELNSLGFIGPIEKPLFDEKTQRIHWNGSEYEIEQIPEDEILEILEIQRQEEYENQLKLVNYFRFWDLFLKSEIYKKLRISSTQSLATNSFYTELIVLFSEAKFGQVDINKIQESINILFFIFDFTDDEVESIQEILLESRLDFLYSLPDSEYLSTHTYNSQLNCIESNN